ncbi:hypothetical protein ABZ816_05570 [Actinosynnema sp. NPDC047251]|uniref:Putative secreted protein n=1 Tax=Saccharothrix espanaensis (strain ATCC 51144 / DSM 44229 / JCM 9112 / NBRC 15066 / NRRL 15764) TaxID=1179773 RepID=K0JV78_SACES|nr:hypothetical protein [Saccharothrix espanaensis]CCH28078.1 putative secreted protein [Saccharothrix espanaensis DSM 44229]
MRLRVAALTAALVLAAPASALAADGKFEYRYNDSTGDIESGQLVDPESRECIGIPEVENEHGTFAFRPRNATTSTVTLFKGSDCEGDHYTLRPGGKASDRLLFRSVAFS